MTFRLFVLLVVLWGQWIAQTDSYPISQGFQPSWYLYGWPLCFATGSRSRFVFSGFSLPAFLIDAVVSAAMLGGAWLTVRQWEQRAKRKLVSIRTAVACVAGLACVYLVMSDGYTTVLEAISFPPPSAQVSEVEGNSRSLSRIDPYAVPSLAYGAFFAGDGSVVALSLIWRFASWPKCQVPKQDS